MSVVIGLVSLGAADGPDICPQMLEMLTVKGGESTVPQAKVHHSVIQPYGWFEGVDVFCTNLYAMLMPRWIFEQPRVLW